MDGSFSLPAEAKAFAGKQIIVFIANFYCQSDNGFCVGTFFDDYIVAKFKLSMKEKPDPAFQEKDE